MGVGNNAAAGKSVARTTGLPAGSSITICGWFQIRTLANGPTLISMENAATPAGFFVELVTAGNKLGLSREPTGTGDVNFTSQPSINTWIFVAVTNNSAGSLIAYWANVGDTSLQTLTHGTGSLSFTPTSIRILNDSFGDTIDAIAADIKIWSAELSSTELLQEMKVGFAVRQTNLYAVWPLRNNADTTDSSGLAHAPTFNGALTTEVVEPVTWSSWIPRFVDSALPARSLSAAVVATTGSFSPVLPPAPPVVAPTVGYVVAPDIVRGPAPRPHGGVFAPIALGQLAVPPLSWAAVYPDIVRGRAPLPIESPTPNAINFSAPAATPLSWAAKFPDQVVPKKISLIEGGGTLPVIPPPVQVDWAELIFFSEAFETEVVLQTWACFPDTVAGPRRWSGYSFSVTQPPLTTTTPAPNLSWQPRLVDDTRLPPRPLWDGVSVSVPQLPQFTPPATSWAAKFAELVWGPRRPVGEGLAVSLPALPALPPPALSWAATYADSAPGPRRPVAEGLVVNHPELPQYAPPALAWAAEYPDSVPIAARRPVAEGLVTAEPWLQNLPVLLPGFYPVYPDIVRALRPLVPTGVHALAPFPLPNPGAIPGWQNSFPDVILRNPRLVPEGLATSITQLGQLTPPALSWAARFPDRVWGSKPLVAEGLSVLNPFPLSTFPILAWAASFPDRALAPRQPVGEGLSVSQPYLSALPPPALSWAARFADRAWGPQRPVGEGLSVLNPLPLGTFPVLAWAAQYPDRTLAPRRPVGEGLAVSQPYLSALPPPALSWAGVYPEVARAARRPVAEGLSVIHPFPFATVPQLSWAAVYPDRVLRAPRPVGEGLVVGVPYLPSLPVPALAWAAAYPERALAARRPVGVGLSVGSVLPIVPPLVPNLSWAAVFPDEITPRLYPVREGLYVSEPWVDILPPPPGPPGAGIGSGAGGLPPQSRVPPQDLRAEFPELGRGVRPLQPHEVNRTLAASLISIVDTARQLYTDFGLRVHRVFLVHQAWTGDRVGVGEPIETSRTEILPTPRVLDMSGTVLALAATGNTEDGSITVDQISQKYAEDDLMGRTPDLLNPQYPRTSLDNIEFFWEVVEHRPNMPLPVRRRYVPTGVPDVAPGKFQWKVTLQRQDYDRARDGSPRGRY